MEGVRGYRSADRVTFEREMMDIRFDQARVPGFRLSQQLGLKIGSHQFDVRMSVCRENAAQMSDATTHVQDDALDWANPIEKPR
jgi:hypothetical protein